MKSNNIRLLLLISFISMAGTLTAQLPLRCISGKINDSALNAAISYENSIAHKPQQVDYLVRVWFHIFSNSDGSNIAATPAQVASEFASLQASFAPDNICFLFAGIDYTNSTALNMQFNADDDEDGAAFNSFQVPGCINIFYVQKINGNNDACNPPCGIGGAALGGIPGTFFLVSTGNIGVGNSIGHEMGHNLGLLHTFETAYGYENIDGSNSATAADRVTDTNADPYAYNGSACFSTNSISCFYTGWCYDPKQKSNFSPPYNNLMAYWWGQNSGTCYPNPVATAGQFTRIESFLANNAALIACTSPANITQADITVSSGYYIKSAVNTFTTSGNVTFNGNAINTLGGGAVVITPGFRANPASGGLTVLMAKPCN